MTTAVLGTRTRLGHMSLRYRLVSTGIVTVIASLLMIFQASHAYGTAFQLFSSIVVDSSVKVDASISALQHLASINKFAADLIGYSQTSDQQQALTSIYAEFQNFRDQMFTIREGLSQTEEIRVYTQAEQAIYTSYWPQLTKLIDVRFSQGKEAAVSIFNGADQIFKTEIMPRMSELEKVNYTAMLDAKTSASGVILLNAGIVAIIGIGLAVFITAVSFWLRRKIRRYLTPGIDLAAVLTWLLTLVIVAQLLGLPEHLRVMVQDSYYSITASARVIADANQANVTESAALNDPASATRWQQQFDQYVRLVTLRLCGQPDCLSRTFSLGGADIAEPSLATAAKHIAPQDSADIDGIIPLMGNITFVGEVKTLEGARLAYLDYLTIDQQTRGLLASNQLDAAIRLNTGRNPGQSDEAFFRFIGLIEQEEAINRAVFNRVWNEQQAVLPTSQTLYVIGGFMLVMALFGIGVYHRFQEL